METPIQLWWLMPIAVKLPLIALLAIAVLSTFRFARVVRRVYSYSGPLETVRIGEVAPNVLAEAAMAGRESSLPLPTATPGLTRTAREVLDFLQLAESTFQFLWERCESDVCSIKRACRASALLSILAVVNGAYPLYFDCFNNSKFTGEYCMFETGRRLSDILSLGVFLCTALYLMASFAHRKLSDRKTCWDYFCACLRNKLLRD
jgi:hypothetical protein